MLKYLRGSGYMDSFKKAYDLVEKNPNYYNQLSPRLQCSPVIARLAIKNKPKLFGKLPECLQEDEKFVYDSICDATIKVDRAPLVLKYIPRHYVESWRFMRKCTGVKPQCVMFAGKNLKSDVDFMYDLVKSDGRLLQYACLNVKNNNRIVLAAVSGRYPVSIKYASLQLRDNTEIGKIVAGERGTAIRFLSERLRGNVDIAKLAVSNTWDAFEYICDELKSNHEVCETLLYNSRHKYNIIPSCVGCDETFIRKVLSFCPEIVGLTCRCGYIYSCRMNRKYKDDFVSTCIIQNPHCFKYFCETVKNNYEYCIQAVKSDPTVIDHITSDDILNNEDIMYEVLCKQKNLWYRVGSQLRESYEDDVELFLSQYQSRYIK